MRSVRCHIWPLLTLVFLIAATIGCDRVTKQMAVTVLSNSAPHSFLADTVRLEYFENAGGFLGVGATWPAGVRRALFTGANGAVLSILGVMVIRRRWSPPMAIGLALFFAGGVSNLIDRATHDRVIDFMNLGIGPIRTGIFNVADMAIMAGAALIAIDGVRRQRRRDTAPCT